MAFAQHFEWARSIGGLGLDAARDVTTDLDGNVIVVGSFSGSASIAGTWFSGEGSNEAFVAKFTSGGNLLWARVITGPYEDMARGVVTESNGSIYVVGHFTDTVTFNISPTDTAAAGSEGGQDIFIVKYDPDGNYVWHRTCGGPEDDTATDIDWYPWSGKLYICGGFQGRGKFGTTAILSNGLTDAYLMKMDADGNIHWVRHGGGVEHDVAAAVAVNHSPENIYVVGDFYEEADFDGTTLQTVGSSDMFIARFDADGNQIWVRSNGGTNVDVATDVGTDQNDRVYVSGYYQLTTIFQSHTATALGYNDVFLAQFDADGNCNWLSSAGSNALDNCLGMAVRWDGTTYMTGMFEDEMFAGNISFEGNGYDIFILCHEPSGQIRYGRNAGAASSDFGMATCLGSDESLYISGYYFYYADFDNNTIGIAENGDGFLAKLTDIVGVETETGPSTSCIRFEGNGTATVSCATSGTWEILDLLGQTVSGGNFRGGRFGLPELQGALYFLKVTDGRSVWTAPFTAM